ncbi:MAG: FAD-dependent oxidoreductase [Salinibacter sp.]
MDRRTFLRAAGLGTAGWAVMPTVSGRWFRGRQSRETDVVVYGGGAGGLCAAVQAARLGADVTVLEPSPWLGGMLTAAGVSALDGNKHGAGGGLVRRFRQALADHYGSLDALHTGWVSLYCYEPTVGHRILEAWVAEQETLTVRRGVEAVDYERVGPRARRVGVAPTNTNLDPTCRDAERTVTCRVFIDATEYGDGLPLANIPYRLGREGRDMLGEPAAPPEPDAEIQDPTYCATLVRRPGAEALPTTPTERAQWDAFQCSVAADCPTPDTGRLNHDLHEWTSFIEYAALPNDKYLLNWPFHANDFPVTRRFFEDRYVRHQRLLDAKRHTLQFVKYMQTELGHPEWQIAEDEYPTADHLPPIPYIRESRRIVTDRMMTQQDVVPTDGNPRAPTIDTPIAVGDYFLDHHHAKAHLPPGCRLTEDYPDNAPFQVPPSVFFPDTDDPSFLVGEKSIAVSHIVNGCTRLQPVVMLMGQALGTYAALGTQEGTAPRDVDVRRVQDRLLDAGCPLYILYDVPAGHALFRPTQELARAGVLRDDDPTKLKPEAPMPAARARTWAGRADRPKAIRQDEGPLRRTNVAAPLRGRLPNADPVSRGAFVEALHAAVS